MRNKFNQRQDQKQDQVQEQMKLRSLNGWLKALSELDKFEFLPLNFEEAKLCSGEMLENIDNCITQTLAPVKQVKEKGISSTLKNRYIINILEWLSLRNKNQFDIIDELSAIVIQNCLGNELKVPCRIQVWDGVISEEELKEFAIAIGKSQVEIEKWILELKEGKKIEFKEIEKTEKGNINTGIKRYEEKMIDLFLQLKSKFWE
ncbi:MAG: hypothetical protein GKR88_05490 [Flavobacteriaceae bacterium]|nr:MAG: hypothetical protein GKR88_05490 [Flavobacteriaceae bacterium]